MLEVVVWDFKVKEGNSHGDGKASKRLVDASWAMQRPWDTERNFNRLF